MCYSAFMGTASVEGGLGYTVLDSCCTVGVSQSGLELEFGVLGFMFLFWWSVWA